MRYLTAMGILALALLAGCSLFHSHADDDGAPPADPGRIEIMAMLANPAGPATTYKLVLEKTKSSYAMIMSPPGGMMELPAGSFEECKALLEKTDYFHMKSARPAGSEGTMSRSIFVMYNGQSHAVEEKLPARASAEFDAVMQFIVARIAR